MVPEAARHRGPSFAAAGSKGTARGLDKDFPTYEFYDPCRAGPYDVESRTWNFSRVRHPCPEGGPPAVGADLGSSDGRLPAMYIEVVDAGHPITRIGGRLWLPVHRKGLPPPPWPLLVFQHGFFNWGACVPDIGVDAPCPPGPPNWRTHRQTFSGYDSLGRHLASQGVAFFSQDCREAEATESPERSIDYRVNLFFSAIETLRRVAGIPIDLTRLAIGGHSNGGAAALLAQGHNRSQDLGYPIRSIVAADHHSDRAGEFGQGDTLGLSHVLALGGRLYRGDANSLWEAHSTLGRVTVVEHRAFNHLYLNERWAEFTDDPGRCQEFYARDNGTVLTGAALASELARLSNWMRCYIGAFCAATLISRDDAWELLREDHRPYLPAAHSEVVSVTNRWVLGG